MSRCRYLAVLDCAGLGGGEAAARRWRFARFVTLTTPLLRLVEARGVAGGALFALRVRAEAGTYVKEWAHGELRRTRPALRDALGARADIVALDVRDVELAWPPR